MQIVKHLVAEITMHCSMSYEKNLCHLVEIFVQIVCFLVLLYVTSEQIDLKVHKSSFIFTNFHLLLLELSNVSFVEFQALGELDNW